MISVAQLRLRFGYNQKTGLLRWLNGHCAGRVAGSLHSLGYIHVHVAGRLYKAHRIIWALKTGSWPSKDVEHKNRIKKDNRWVNLRLTDDSCNQANAGRRKDNTSGFKGVHFRKDQQIYRVRLQVKGKRLYLGQFNCPKQAHAAYVIAAKKHFGEFARAR